MSTAKDITDHLINRAKNLHEFVVTTTLPEDFRFNGEVPFDLKVTDDQLEAKVFAVDFDEAAQRLGEWLETCK